MNPIPPVRLLLAAALLCAALPVFADEAPSLVVTTTDDVVSSTDGKTSLREALAYAASLDDAEPVTFSSSAAGGAVNFHDGQPHTLLVTSELIINGTIAIQGPGASVLTVSGSGTTRIIRVPFGNWLTLSGLTLAQGRAPDNLANNGGTTIDIGGGAIYNLGNLILNACTFAANASGDFTEGGGAISNANAATLTITGCAFTGNSTGKSNYGGGAIYNAGTLSITGSSLTSNSTGASNTGGGAIFTGGRLTMSTSSCSGNSTGTGNSGGGVVYDNGATVTITGCTLSGNQAASAVDGGGALLFNRGRGTIVQSTLSGNTATGSGNGAGAIYNHDATVGIVQGTLVLNSPSSLVNMGDSRSTASTGLANTLVAGGGSVVDEIQSGSGGFSSSGVNFIGNPGSLEIGVNDMSLFTTSTTLTDVIDTHLQNNGGTTSTHALKLTSPCVDTGAALGEIQQVTVGGIGTFTLTFQGQTTGPLSSTSGTLEDDLRTALSALSTIGSGNVAVAQAPAGSVYFITFTGTLAGADMPQLSAATTGTATAAMITLVDGQALPPADQRGSPRPAGAAVDVGAYETQSLAVTSPTSTNVLSTSATLGGSVSADTGATINARGIVYAVTSVNASPLLGGNGVTNLVASGTTGNFSVNAPGLSPATGYTFKAYVTSGGATLYTSATTFITTSVPGSTTTTLSSSLNPATVGASITFTATVIPVPPASGTPTGTVTFSEGGTTLGSAPLSGGSATLTASSFATGSHSITASYADTAAFAGSTSNSVSQTVNAAITLSPSTLPDGHTNAAYSQSITASGGTGAKSLAIGNFNPGGTGLASPAVNGGTATLSGTPSAAGTCSFDLTATDAGGGSITQHYTLTIGTVNVSMSSLVCAGINLNPAFSPFTTAYTVSVPYSVASATLLPISGQAGNSIKVRVNGGGYTSLASGGKSGPLTLNIGTNVIEILVTSPDGTVSTTYAIRAIRYGQPLVSLSASPATLLEGSGGHIVFTFTRDGDPGPSFTANFSVGGTAVRGGDYTATGAATFGAASTIKFAANVTSVSLVIIPVADSTVEADKTIILSLTNGAGYAVNTTAASATGTLIDDDSHVTLTGNPGVFGQPLWLTAAIAGTNGSRTGLVTFKDGTTTIGTVSPMAGVATLGISTLAVGTHSITASYAGDATAGPSTSQPYRQVVAKGSVAITLSSLLNPATAGNNV